jgi:hypothetical protein
MNHFTVTAAARFLSPPFIIRWGTFTFFSCSPWLPGWKFPKQTHRPQTQVRCLRSPNGLFLWEVLKHKVYSTKQQNVDKMTGYITDLWDFKLSRRVWSSYLSSGMYCHVKYVEAARTSETLVDNYSTRQYIPEDKSKLYHRLIYRSWLGETLQQYSGQTSEAMMGPNLNTGKINFFIITCQLWSVIK